MFGLGTGELFLILVVVFLIYGPKRMPELARKMGRMAKDIRQAKDEVSNAVNFENEMDEINDIGQEIQKTTESIDLTTEPEKNIPGKNINDK